MTRAEMLVAALLDATPEPPKDGPDHDELIEVPLGRSNATVQPLIVLVVPLVIVYLAS